MYLGGVRQVRTLTAHLTTGCVLSSALFMVHLAHTHDFRSLAIAIIANVGAVAFAVGVRLAALRTVVTSDHGWMLVPLVGRARPMPRRLVDLYIADDDIVAVGTDGRSFVLGIEKLPFRDHRAARFGLLEALKRFDMLEPSHR